ncbi:hypothetical protein CONLIGDRAFT_649469 [Coniochaeta ligniaria NRRL 30616]|uniref:Amidoligase enzyme n=1 Tax=Coniochaeta ligniaria NRRL 30616 TaxID=1408157 RepID=A0A1J7J7F8_9PEZI|nr:hypothetical protein CONLIGDRAFT_649469 [Coniochaeta ligniaria NRRL 30616]
MSSSAPQHVRPIQPPQTLTFGLEIEMIVPGATASLRISGRDAAFQDPHANDGRWYARGPHLTQNQDDCEETVETCLSAAGLANVQREYQHNPPQVSDEARVSQIYHPNIAMKYHHWRVMSDGSCQCEMWFAEDDVLGRYTWSSVEIASSVFRSSARSDTWISVSPAQKAQLSQICRSLTSHMRIRVAQSCGLHCHIGLGGDTIPPDTVRRFVTTMWLIEDAILMLCAPWRVHSDFALPITLFSRLAREEDRWKFIQTLSNMNADIRMLLGDGVRNRLSTLEQERVKLIWSLPLEDLREAIGTNDGTVRGTVSIQGCCGPVSNPFMCPVQNTIEIRYASSTLVADELTAWTNIFLRLFQLCNFYTDTEAVRLAAVLDHVVDALDPTKGIHAGHELLRQLDLGDDVPVWTAAQRRWALETDHDHVRRSPFVDRQ